MRALYALGLALGTLLVPAASRAETLSDALTRAYLGNPMLNRDRAATRAADEAVSKANGGYRPKVVGTGFLGYSNADVTGGRAETRSEQQLAASTSSTIPTTSTANPTGAVSPTGTVNPTAAVAPTVFQGDLQRTGVTFPKDGALSVTETLFDGNRTTNGVRRAETQDLGSREALRETEQETLLAGATAYMDVLRDTALEELARNQIRVLEYELRGARARYRANEVTFTDVAEVATNLARSRTNFFRSQAALETSIGTYRKIIGTLPTRLEAARPIDAVAPATREGAIALAMREHPSIAQALHAVDAAAIAVQLREGELYPTVSLVGTGEASEQRGQATNHRTVLETQAHVTVPIYNGGQVYAAVRQAKEQVALARFKADSVREQVRASVASSWGQLDATKALIYSAKEAVRASEVALVDVRAEASMGQRTTYDVLLAIQALFTARATLVSAQRDRVVDSYQLAAAIGRLDAADLGLAVTPYDPTIHFAQVKDKWFGLRTPDGR